MLERLRAQERLDAIQDGLAVEQRVMKDRGQRIHIQQLQELAGHVVRRRTRRAEPMDRAEAEQALAAAGFGIAIGDSS